VTPESPSRWWKTDTEGPVFDARERRSKKDTGGNLPSSAPAAPSLCRTITDSLGGRPALLFGVATLRCAHSETKAWVIADWECHAGA